ncbi:5888_t:CDS:2 [Gigaspora margarita]|uniref:5888_t:CDS:1 n=1 Tax=Gigaspora margarita TaxID=4874 RepID=A0ABM8W360_GIGMA|nr:5888_t:CDS:2 [Gigaspora margarita]
MPPPEIFKTRQDKKDIGNFINWTSNNKFIDQLIRNCQTINLNPDAIVEWIPFENFKDIKFKTEGGFGKIYTAVLCDGWILDWDKKNSKSIRTGSNTVVLKSIYENFEEVTSNIISNLGSYGVKCYGITCGKTEKENVPHYMLVLKYMEKPLILHNSNMVHRDLHPKNILSDQERWFLSDFGLCGPADDNPTNIYGRIPSSYSDIMKRCWDTNPEQRPDAKELFNHFDKMLEQIGTENDEDSSSIHAQILDDHDGKYFYISFNIITIAMITNKLFILDKIKNSDQIDDDSEILQHLNIEDNKKLEKSENLFALKLSQHMSSDISNKNFKNIEDKFDNLLILELSQDISNNISRKNSGSIGGNYLCISFSNIKISSLI